MMRILFFGKLTEVSGAPHIDVEAIQDVDSLKARLTETFPELGRHTYLVAINKKVGNGNEKLNSNDTVALLPPFSGG